MIHPRLAGLTVSTMAVLMSSAAAVLVPIAHADNDNNTLIPNNQRLNNGVLANVYTAQQLAGCNHDVNMNPQLQLAAQRHTDDLMNNRDLDGDLGSDGLGPQDRANAAGYQGTVAETVAINPALAISGMEILNQWYGDPAEKAIMTSCAYSQMGVWSENSLDRTVVVAVYGQPPTPPAPLPSADSPSPLNLASGQPLAIDPSPDYDASDELEFGLSWSPADPARGVPATGVGPGGLNAFSTRKRSLDEGFSCRRAARRSGLGARALLVGSDSGDGGGRRRRASDGAVRCDGPRRSGGVHGRRPARGVPTRCLQRR